MKNVLLGAVLVVFFVSCGDSPEDKANELIQEEIKKVLYHAETYDPVETLVDSAFTPFDDPDFYEKTLQLCELGIAVEKYERNMKSAKSSMAIWSGPYMSTYARNSYQEAKEEYDENAEDKRKAEEKAYKLVSDLKAVLEKEPQFIGFKARHRYRANNNAGQTVFGEAEFLFDEDISRVVTVYNMDDEKYKAVQLLYRQMLDQDIKAEDGTLGRDDLWGEE